MAFLIIWPSGLRLASRLQWPSPCHNSHSEPENGGLSLPDGAHAAAPGSFDVYKRHMCATSIWVRRLVGPAEPTLLWCGPAARRSRKPRSRARNNRRRSARCIRCDGWVHGTLSQAEKAPDTMFGERHQVADGTVGRRKYFFLLAIVNMSDGNDTSLTHLCDHRLCRKSASYACRVTKRP